MLEMTHPSRGDPNGWTGNRPAVLAAAALQLISLIVIAAVPAQARQEEWVHVGSLDCTMGPSIGLVMGGLQQARCVFVSNRTQVKKTYIGRIERIAWEAGIPSGGKFLWKVFAKKTSVSRQEIAGSYQAASADNATEGLGHDVLAGARRALVLQPVSVEGSWKGNLAFGVTTLRLE